MSHVTAMLDAYPKDLGNIDRQKLTDRQVPAWC